MSWTKVSLRVGCHRAGGLVRRECLCVLLNQEVIPFMVSTSRRTLVKGAAWAVPAITVAAAAPAVALSATPALPTGNTFLSIAARDVNNPEIKDPIYDYYATTDSVSLPTVFWSSENSTPTHHWVEGGCQTATTFSRGVGVFTPHGTMGTAADGKKNAYTDSAVNGSGLWIGSPVDERGRALPGRTVLSAGTTIVVTVRAKMSDEKWVRRWNGEELQERSSGALSYLWGPRISGWYVDNRGRDARSAAGNQPGTWGRRGTRTIDKKEGTSNGWRVAQIGVPMTCTMVWGRDPNAAQSLLGTATFTLDKDLVVEGKDGRQRFNQVMVNTGTIWEAALNEQVSEVTWSLEVTAGRLTTAGKVHDANKVFPKRSITIAHASNPLATC